MHTVNFIFSLLPFYTKREKEIFCGGKDWKEFIQSLLDNTGNFKSYPERVQPYSTGINNV